MSGEHDPELLAGFVEEARPYLHAIPAHIRDFLADSTRVDLVEEVFRLVHSIKGASSMMGMAMLSQLAHKLELAVEEIGSCPGEVPATTLGLTEQTLATIDAYLDLCTAGEPGNTAGIAALLAAWENPEFPSHRGDTVPPSSASLTIAAEELRAELADGSEDPMQFDLSGEVAGPSDEFPAFAPFDGGEGWNDFAGETPAAPDESAIPPELLEIFSLEAEDHLKVITGRLPELRESPNSREIVQEIRRSAHTLKGSAAMVGFDQITHLAHRMEDLLDQMYEGGRTTTPEILDILFKSTDVLEDLAAGKNRRPELEALYSEYAVLLNNTAPAASVEKFVPETLPDIALEAPAEHSEEAAAEAGPRRDGRYLRVPIEKLDALVKLVSELVISRSEFEQRLGSYLHQVEELQLSTSRLRRASGKLETEYEAKALGSGRSALPGKPAPASPLALTHYQNYGFDDLEFDRYTDFHLISRELSETATDIHTLSGELRSLKGEFDSYLTRQTRLSSELQDKLMRVRMVPLSTLGSRLERTVRNAAELCGKRVELILDGERTELDKQVLEEMAEPLLHLLRNAVDHGLESPAQRELAGKPATGTIRVRAYAEGTQVGLQITDDGRGIDPKALRASIVSKGFASAAELEHAADAELLNYIFTPGFSTAKTLSELSGRGVGLDIVRSQAQRLKGTVSVTSAVGRGTTFTIRLPLTLAVMRALLVKAGGQVFALPLGAVSQIFRIEPEMVETLGEGRVVRLGDKYLPLHHLGNALGLRNPVDETVKHPPAVVVRAGDREIALAVDHLQGGREIVVKSMGSHVRTLPGIAGATIMGDGSVVLIINPSDLLESDVVPRFSTPARNPSSVSNGPTEGRFRVLIVDDSPSVRRVVSTIFQRVNWISETAKDGVEALELLHQSAERPDAIVLDIEMPRMDGYEFLSTLRAGDAFRDIPVVMVTSRAGQKHRVKAMELGANAYLVKPYQDDRLIETVREVIADAAGVPA